MSTLIAISTFKKVDALSVLLQSLLDRGYFKGNQILVTDDNAGMGYQANGTNFSSAQETVEAFNLEFGTNVICISGKRRGGVAVNKNRAIKFFLENKDKFDDLLLLDDDIVFTAPGLLDLIRSSNEPHMTGFLGSPDDPTGNKIAFGETATPFFKTFPPQGETETHYYCFGSQGVLLYYTKDCISSVGYFDRMPDHYGFEHSLHSNRVNAFRGLFYDWFPVLKNCGQYFQSQSIANNYQADYSKNQKYWLKRKEEIARGIDLVKLKFSED